MVVVAIGTAFDGIKLFGPFESAEDATDWASTEIKKEPWWVVPVEEP